ncbi:MAG: tRNA adenosine(34) deaminase TadA [Cyanobacteria bacterium P01_D01_bin.128]
MPFSLPPSPIDSDTYSRHRHWMAKAIAIAEEAGIAGEVPVGAIVIDNNHQLIAAAANRRQRDQDPTAHAEILALREASARLGTWRLTHCTLYVTLEPCMMCSGALIAARLGLLVYGADDFKTGSVRSVLNLPDSPASNHRLSVVGGILAVSCREQLQQWFAQRRASSPSPF